MSPKAKPSTQFEPQPHAHLLEEDGSAVAKPRFRPIPDGVVEHAETHLNGRGGIVQLQDGSLMFAYPTTDSNSYRISTDKGKTWGDPQPLKCEVKCQGIIPLASGKLGMYGNMRSSRRWDIAFSSSDDDGKSWTPPAMIPNYARGDLKFYPEAGHCMIQLKSGRLLIVGYWCHQIDPPDAADTQAYSASNSGLWRGRWLWVEGHRTPAMGMALVYYSDDQGKTWTRSGTREGGLFGWFDEHGVPNGLGGTISVVEPVAAETKDGRVLLFGRSKCGRVVQSYSLNGGENWFSILPTELASAAAPATLVQIPRTGDLLCVWNQVSGEEIRRGFSRGRLSAAISTDSGRSWKNFKTLELSEGMEDIARIVPEFPIARVVRGRPGLGQLPDGYAMFTYSTVDIVGDQVFIRYPRTWPIERPGKGLASDPHKMQLMPGLYEERGTDWRGEGVMRIYPLDYFYQVGQ